MTDDKDLIARLREGATWDDDVAAANRIEALTKERDTAREYAGEVRIREKVADDARIEAEAKLATCEKYRDAYAEMGRIGTQAVRDLEAKLAECEARLGKAVEALLTIVDNGGAGSYHLARATLAEIKSGVATTPYGLKGESHE